MQPSEEVTRLIFIPAITDRYICSDNERNLFALPITFGGLGLLDYTVRHKILNIETQDYALGSNWSEKRPN